MRLTNEKIKIAFVGNFHGHGRVYDQWGTSFCLLLSLLDYVESVDVICPSSISGEEILFPEKIRLRPTFDASKPFSVLNIIAALDSRAYDLVIFNYGPTVYGKGNLINLLGIFIPIFASRIRNTVIISQGSSLTNDPFNLGYNSLIDRMKYMLLIKFEKILYRRVKSFAQLPIYEKLLKMKVTKNRVIGILRSDYIDAIFTLYLNNKLNVDSIDIGKHMYNPTVLLHGFWGPQKDPELALSTLKSLSLKGYRFNLIISGGINVHFPGYESHFKEVLKKYNDIPYNYTGYVDEKELMGLFLGADLVLMPYRVPGGQSGVLEMSSFFGNNVICLDFPEFRDEVKKDDRIDLVERGHFYDAVEKFLKNYQPSARTINVIEKLDLAKKNIREFLKESLDETF